MTSAVSTYVNRIIEIRGPKMVPKHALLTKEVICCGFPKSLTLLDQVYNSDSDIN